MARLSRKKHKLDLRAIVQRDGKRAWLKTKNCFIIIFRGILYGLSLLTYLNILRYIHYFCKYLFRPRKMADQYGYLNSVIYKPSFSERFMQLFRSDTSNKRKLLEWVQSRIPKLGVTDFTSSWCDGIALCALIDAVIPGACPRYDLLNPKQRVNNCRLGFKLVTKKFGIQEPISPEQMADPTRVEEGKLRSYIESIFCASQIPREENEGQKTTSATSHEMIKYKEKCTAAGSGLHVGEADKRAKFNIMTKSNQLPDLFVQIVGPKGEKAREKIVNEIAGRGCLRGHSKGVKGSKVESGGERLLLDYQCVRDGQFQVSYTPFNEGLHEISIIWDGDQIDNSPFQVNVRTVAKEFSKSKKTVSFEDENSIPLKVDPTKARRLSLCRQHHLASDSSDADSHSPHGNLERSDLSAGKYSRLLYGKIRNDSISGGRAGNLVGMKRQSFDRTGTVRTRRRVIRRIISTSTQGSSTDVNNTPSSISSNSLDSFETREIKSLPVRHSVTRVKANDVRRQNCRTFEKYATKTAISLIKDAFTHITDINKKAKELKMRTRDGSKKIIQPRMLSKEESIEEASTALLQRKMLEYNVSEEGKGGQNISMEESFDNEVPLSPVDAEEPVTNMLLRKKMERYGSDDVLRGERMDSVRQSSVDELADKLLQRKLEEYKQNSLDNEDGRRERKSRQPPGNLAFDLDEKKSTGNKLPSPNEKSLRSPLTKMKSFGKIFDNNGPPYGFENETTIMATDEDGTEITDNVTESADHPTNIADCSDNKQDNAWPFPLTPIRESSQELVSQHSVESQKAQLVTRGTRYDFKLDCSLVNYIQCPCIWEDEHAPTDKPIKTQPKVLIYCPCNTVTGRLNLETPSPISTSKFTNPVKSNIENGDVGKRDDVDAGYHSDQVVSMVKSSSIEKTPSYTSHVSDTGRDHGVEADSTRKVETPATVTKTRTTIKIRYCKSTQCSAQEIKEVTGWKSRRSIKPVAKATICIQTDIDTDVDAPDYVKKQQNTEIYSKEHTDKLVTKRPTRRGPKRQSTFDSGFSDVTHNGKLNHHLKNNQNGHDDVPNHRNDNFERGHQDPFSNTAVHDQEIERVTDSARIHSICSTFDDGSEQKTLKSPKLSETGFAFKHMLQHSSSNSLENDKTDSGPKTTSTENCDNSWGSMPSMDSFALLDLPPPRINDRDNWYENIDYIDRFLTERGFQNKYEEWTELFASLDADTNSFSQEEVSLPAGIYEGRRSVPDADDYHVASSRCEAVGAGLISGFVMARNNFQVKSENAGNGSLTVGVVGPKPNSVTETSVVYTGDNLYEVVYEVNRPGYYVINVKWADMNIPCSPFVVRITY